MLWLHVVRSNNSPDGIASFFLSTITYGGCPVKLVTNLGIENGLAVSLQCFFQDNPDAHRYMFRLLATNALKRGGPNFVSNELPGGEHFSLEWHRSVFLINLSCYIRKHLFDILPILTFHDI